MKFKFSIRRLLILTTFVATLMGAANLVGMSDLGRGDLKILALAGFAYYGAVAFFFGKRYYRHWNQIRKNFKELRLRRLELEQEVQQLQAEQARDKVSTID